ncbi:hypothetical protein D3C87_1256300 [compost metagenome]
MKTKKLAPLILDNFWLTSAIMALISFIAPRSLCDLRRIKATPADGLVDCVKILKPAKTFNVFVKSAFCNCCSASANALDVRSKDAPAGIESDTAIKP